MLVVVRIVTIQSMLMFLLAITYDLQSPSDYDLRQLANRGCMHDSKILFEHIAVLLSVEFDYHR